jgi:hypothetical protein
MRIRRAAVLTAAFLTLALGPATAIAVQPAPGPVADAWAAGVERGTSGTFDLTDGGHVHIQRTPAGAQAHAAAIGAAGTGNGINYWGGPVVPAEHVVSIYWAKSTIFSGGPTAGTSSTSSTDGSLVGTYLNSLGGSNYYNINTTYTDTVGGGHTVANSLNYTGFWADNGPTAPASGSSPSDAAIQAEIVNYFTTTKTAPDPATVYAVFSASGVNLGGGAYTSYCAYHGYFAYNGSTVLYAAMPYDYNPSCNLLNGSPNNDPGGDAEVNVLSHELEEANTDPQLNAWYDTTGAENGDKCAWNFGTEFLSTKNGSGYANITVGGRDYLVQQNWLNANGGGCYQGYTSPAPSKLTTVTVSPASASVTTGGQQQFTAIGYDQYGATMNPQPSSFTWAASGDGTVSTAGLFTADSTTGSATVTALSGGVKGTASVTVTATPVLKTITVSPATASVTTGGQQQYTATGYDQYGATISPQQGFTWTVSGGGTMSGGLFTAGSTASGPFTVTAASGSVNGTASVTVTSVPAGFTISATPTSQSVRRGNSAGYTVTITPSGGFTGSISLSLTGQPSGSSVTFTPNNTSLTSSTLRVATLSTTSRRTYTLTIKAVSGSLSHTSNVTLTVTR